MRYSEQSAFNNCPYKYYLSHELGLNKIQEGESAHDKNWGAGIHEALRCHYLGKSWEEIKQSFLLVYPTSLNEDDKAKTVESGLECISRYRDFYKTQDNAWEVLSTEEEGKITIGGEDHDLHIDLIARNKQSGDIYLWDHKTTGKTASVTYWKGFELSAQLTRYVCYVQEKYGSCAGAIINNICVGHRQRVYKGEPAGFWCKFERQIFNRTKQQIDFWKKSDQEWMRQIEFSRNNNCWPKALNKLCAWCEYYELCLSSHDEQIEQLLYTRTNKASSHSEKEGQNET